MNSAFRISSFGSLIGIGHISTTPVFCKRLVDNANRFGGKRLALVITITVIIRLILLRLIGDNTN